MSEPLLSARGLKKTYVMGRRTLEVLRGVDLDIQRGGFVALCGSLLTAVPLTPGGLGFVEAGGIGLLSTVFGIPFPEASAIVLIDRAISVFSIVVLGSVAYVISSKPRGSGIKVEEVTRVPDSTD